MFTQRQVTVSPWRMTREASIKLTPTPHNSTCCTPVGGRGALLSSSVVVAGLLIVVVGASVMVDVANVVPGVPGIAVVLRGVTGVPAPAQMTS